MATPLTPGKSISAQRLEGRTAESLDDVSKIYRDAFVREYIKDFNGQAAMARLGFTGDKRAASKRSGELLREPYVANLLHDTVRSLQPSDIVSRGQVMASLWKEGNNAFLCSTRVAALAHIARMLGMDRPEKEEGNQAPQAVMMIPCMRAEDWESSAAMAQALLKQQAAATV